MGDYFAHWLSMAGKTDAAKLPRLYFVNWFRKNEDGKFVWPGFGDNARVLKWIAERLDGEATAVDTPGGTDTVGLVTGPVTGLVASLSGRGQARSGFVRPEYRRSGSLRSGSLRSGSAPTRLGNRSGSAPAWLRSGSSRLGSRLAPLGPFEG
jgi:hypothetical protein